MAWSSGLQLRVTAGNDEGRIVLLNSPEITLGRAVETSESSPGWVLFSEPTVSRIHALLKWDDDNQCFVLQHRSRTNPTLVRGVPVDGYPLHLHEKVSLGLLEFELEPAEVRSGKLGDAVKAPPSQGMSAGVFDALSNYAKQSNGTEREQMIGMAGMIDASSSENSQKFSMVVIQGPDKGTTYPLNEPVLVIGRLAGPADPRRSAGVLLRDTSVPQEQALLVWQDRAATYGILQSDSSSQATRIRRMSNGMPREIIVRSDIPTVLNERDIIMIGHTAMILSNGQSNGAANFTGNELQEFPQVDEEYNNQPQMPARSPLRSWRNSQEQYNEQDYQQPYQQPYKQQEDYVQQPIQQPGQARPYNMLQSSQVNDYNPQQYQPEEDYDDSQGYDEDYPFEDDYQEEYDDYAAPSRTPVPPHPVAPPRQPVAPPRQPIAPPRPAAPSRPVGAPRPAAPPRPTGAPRPVTPPRQPVAPPRPASPPRPTGAPRPAAPPRPTGAPRPAAPSRPTGAPRPAAPPRPAGAPRPAAPSRPTGAPRPATPPRPAGTPRRPGAPRPAAPPRPVISEEEY